MFLTKLVLVHLRTSRCLTLLVHQQVFNTVVSDIFLSEFGHLRECGISSCNCEISNRSPSIKHPDRNKHLSLISSSPQIAALSICDSTTTNNLIQVNINIYGTSRKRNMETNQYFWNIYTYIGPFILTVVISFIVKKQLLSFQVLYYA